MAADGDVGYCTAPPVHDPDLSTFSHMLTGATVGEKGGGMLLRW